MTPETGLQCDALRVRREGFELFADWRVADGDRVAVMGPSGAGKSTLLLALAGFVPPASGQIRWQGRALDPHPAARPMSMIFQDGNLFPHLTAAQNVGLGLSPALKLGASERDRIEAALARVGLSGRGGDKPGALSGGQQARVTLARAIVRERPILLLDEPFGALGPALAREMIELMLEVVAGLQATLFVVTHNPEEAARVAELGIVVSEGVAAPPEDLGSLLRDPPESLRAYL